LGGVGGGGGGGIGGAQKTLLGHHLSGVFGEKTAEVNLPLVVRGNERERMLRGLTSPYSKYLRVLKSEAAIYSKLKGEITGIIWKARIRNVYQ